MAKKKSTTTPTLRSFKRSPNPPFLVFRITHQTVYWLILGALILALGIWTVILSLRVQTLYDQIDKNASSDVRSAPTKQQ